MGVALRCRHPGMAKHLLDDADMDALLNQQSRSGVPRIVDPGVADLRLGEDGLPGPPVLGAFDRAAALGGENQIALAVPLAKSEPERNK